jgi:hypothetical protein
MNITAESFRKVFVSRFWKKLDDSIVPFMGETPRKEEFLNDLHRRICDYSYFPSRPREYIYLNKHNGAVRFVPTFERADYCTFFFCVKMLEDEIALNRVENTFGGWTLGNKIRLQEEEEACEVAYAPPNSLDAGMWSKQWGTFQDVIKAAKQKINWSHCISFDIANFYDNINLQTLERKLRHAVSTKKQDVVGLLMQFLLNWNREIEGYCVKSTGLPQDEIGDCSRILANFYLQEHDEYMAKIAVKHQCLYTRYTDDQIIFASNEQSARTMVFEASMSLFKLGLNLNASKIREYQSVQAFEEYWSFDLFELLKNPSPRQLNQACQIYFDNIEKGLCFRQNSVLKRLLNQKVSEIKPDLKYKLISHLFEEPHIIGCDQYYLTRFRALVNNDEEFFGFLDKFGETCLYNSFHYHVKKYYKKHRAGYDLTPLRSQIAVIKADRMKLLSSRFQPLTS